MRVVFPEEPEEAIVSAAFAAGLEEAGEEGLLADAEGVLEDEDREEDDDLEEDVRDEELFLEEDAPDLDIPEGEPTLDEDLAGSFLEGVSTEDISTECTRVEPVRMLGATLSERWLPEEPAEDLAEPDPPLTADVIFLTLEFLESFSISQFSCFIIFKI